MMLEYIDFSGGDQSLFGESTFEEILAYANEFRPIGQDQTDLKELVILGIFLATPITEEQIARNKEFEHRDLGKFYQNSREIGKKFIQPYYKSKIR